MLLNYAKGISGPSRGILTGLIIVYNYIQKRGYVTSKMMQPVRSHRGVVVKSLVSTQIPQGITVSCFSMMLFNIRVQHAARRIKVIVVLTLTILGVYLINLYSLILLFINYLTILIIIERE